MRTLEYRISYEKMISRIPALFAYLEENEVGEMVLHKATDSIMGCYGKIVQDIKIPEEVKLDLNNVSVEYFDGNEDVVKDVIVKGGLTYSYRTLIDYYYEFVDFLPKDDTFKKFMEEGIGKVEVDPDIREGYPAVPKFVFIADARNLYNFLAQLKKKCKLYDDGGSDDTHLCCECEKFKQYNGDEFMEFLQDQIQKAYKTAEEYFKCANQENGMTLNLKVDLTSTYQDFGIMTPGIGQWMPYKKYGQGEKVFYDGTVWVCEKETTGKWDDELEMVIFDYDSFVKYDFSIFENDNCDKICEKVENEENVELPFAINGKTDSKLVDLRRFPLFTNLDGRQELPEKGVDWLYFYRKGVVMNMTMLSDNFANLLNLDGNTANKNDGEKLMIYGDVIEDITADKNKHTITFIYHLGVHLKAEYDDFKLDDDGNVLHYWKNFEWDGNDKVGIKYEETYTYEEGGDLDNLINGKYKPFDGYNGEEITFEEYIEGDFDDTLKFVQFEFFTSDNNFIYEKRFLNEDKQILSLITDFEVYRNDYDEFIKANNLRMEYFNGISYSPSVENNVSIDRGVTSVFDKHIKFSEVKTLESMTEYSNGSFFKMSES